MYPLCINTPKGKGCINSPTNQEPQIVKPTPFRIYISKCPKLMDTRIYFKNPCKVPNTHITRLYIFIFVGSEERFTLCILSSSSSKLLTTLKEIWQMSESKTELPKILKELCLCRGRGGGRLLFLHNNFFDFQLSFSIVFQIPPQLNGGKRKISNHVLPLVYLNITLIP